eukprot:CAMPEP_0119314028 /NCGR_PEP_ID=MMETSP1333-20130426/31337_1 /TAXON_ID=418940 /ORGANISM="Scyphosphaera apsteinii, Strain RCC1455" /LENGTH=281 /DNA_ID=CAMNT_0007319041 /DNA_START=503 /DNA_END=1348 /DNA_ORIENTATION=+
MQLVENHPATCAIVLAHMRSSAPATFSTATRTNQSYTDAVAELLCTASQSDVPCAAQTVAMLFDEGHLHMLLGDFSLNLHMKLFWTSKYWQQFDPGHAVLVPSDDILGNPFLDDAHQDVLLKGFVLRLAVDAAQLVNRVEIHERTRLPTEEELAIQREMMAIANAENNDELSGELQAALSPSSAERSAEKELELERLHNIRQQLLNIRNICQQMPISVNRVDGQPALLRWSSDTRHLFPNACKRKCMLVFAMAKRDETPFSWLPVEAVMKIVEMVGLNYEP